MIKEDKEKIVIDKTHEPRKKGISRMIGEGGLGAEKYYEIKKEKKHEEKAFKDDDD